MGKEGFVYRDKTSEIWSGWGVDQPKSLSNLGVMNRTLVSFGISDFLFICGDLRYDKPHSDVIKSPKRVPLFHYKNFQDMYDHLPMNCELIGVELCDRAKPIETFEHPKRAVYIFGGEENGLSKEAIKMCRHIIKLPTTGVSMNLSSCASMVMWDRHIKLNRI